MSVERHTLGTTVPASLLRVVGTVVLFTACPTVVGCGKSIDLNKLARIVVDPMYTHDRRLLGLLDLPGLPGPGTTGRLGNPALRG